MVKKKGGESDDEEGLVITFTPAPGFDIRKAARHMMELMEDLQQPLLIHLPHVSVEFEVGCTRKEIIDGYNQALKAQMNIKPSNSNTRSGKKKE